MTTAETITGVIEARNDRGVRVQGEWRNLSKFRPLELPAVGATVELGLDPKGFINTLQVLDEPMATPAVRTVGGTAAATRLAVLQAAATFAACRPAMKSTDVITVAQSWLEWVTRQEAGHE